MHRCSNLYVYVGFSRHNIIPHCSAYNIEESNPVLASGLHSRSGSKVNQFIHVPTSVDTQHFIQIHARIFWVILLTDRQTDRQTNERGQKHIPPPLSEVKKVQLTDGNSFICVIRTQKWHWFYILHANTTYSTQLPVITRHSSLAVDNLH